MTSITLPRRRLWGNLHVLCEAPWDLSVLRRRSPASCVLLSTLLFSVVVTPSGLLRAGLGKAPLGRRLWPDLESARVPVPSVVTESSLTGAAFNRDAPLRPHSEGESRCS